MRQTVPDFLGQSAAAKVLSKVEMGEGCGIAIWENEHDHVRYNAPQNHTFSLYLQGGTDTRRADQGFVAGFPGAICVMPEGCDSEWQIGARFRFLHLYINDTRLRSGFARTHDCDARGLDLDEETFTKGSRFVAPLSQLADAALTGEPMRAEAALAELIAALHSSPKTFRAGLAPHTLRKVDEWIEEHLENRIHLSDLASLADLSDFHFHRMFKLVRGVPPHLWVTQRRLERARSLLLRGRPIAEVAVAAGFSSQSHLTRAFRRYFGTTPASYCQTRNAFQISGRVLDFGESERTAHATDWP